MSEMIISKHIEPIEHGEYLKFQVQGEVIPDAALTLKTVDEAKETVLMLADGSRITVNGLNILLTKIWNDPQVVNQGDNLV